MDILKARSELKRMSKGNLFKLVEEQRISRCLIGAKACGFSLQYHGMHFCVSELLGKGCPVERFGQWEQIHPKKEGINVFLPTLHKMETELLSEEKKPVEFKVYYRDDLARSMVYLGTVVERRRRERGNNLRDLLKKALREYSDYVKDPSKIFLLSNEGG